MRSIGNVSPTITTEIKTPAEALRALCESGWNWLSELREMRGKVLFNELGGGSIFLSRSGTYADADLFDAHAHHIVLRAGQRIAACARVSVLNPEVPGYVSTTLGHRRLEELLSQMGAHWETGCEASRWIVAHEYRNLGLGPRVVAAAWALAQRLEMRIGFVLACTRHGQDHLLCRMGARPVEGVGLIPAGIIDDSLRLLYFNMCLPAHVSLERMGERNVISPMSATTGVARLSPSRMNAYQ